MAGNTSGLVSAAKPQKGGAIFTAPAGTAIPTDATTALDPAFVKLGYASNEGLSNTSSVILRTCRIGAAKPSSP